MSYSYVLIFDFLDDKEEDNVVIPEDINQEIVGVQGMISNNMDEEDWLLSSPPLLPRN